MSLTDQEVEKIAHLARIQLEPEERARYLQELNGILDLVAQMNRVDTEGVSPMAHPLHMVQRLRPDSVTEPDRRETFQAIAPLTEEGLYLVPKVIE